MGIELPTPHQEPESSETISQNISIAELEIAEKIQNGSKLCKGRAMKILELMRNNQTKVNFSTNENTGPSITQKRERITKERKRERITKERKREIREHIETNITDPRKKPASKFRSSVPHSLQKEVRFPRI